PGGPSGLGIPPRLAASCAGFLGAQFLPKSESSFMNKFDILHVISLGWPVLSVLLIFSILTLAVLLESHSLVRRPKDSLSFGKQGVADAKHLLDRLEKRLAILGTIANAAPFVGLLGTVIGIIRAFHNISQASTSGGGMALVAGGISEALISTAAGLAVAIP